MRKTLLLTLIIIIAVININAQKKLIFDVNVGLNNSIGKDIIKPHYIGYLYFSRKKYEHPYLNIKGNISYRVINNILVGIQSGIYINILEQYVSIAQRTTISVPLQLTGRYTFLRSEQNSSGINATYGFNFFNIYDRIERYRNGKILDASIFYLINNKHLLKIGIEKQTDNVIFYVYKYNVYHPNEIFNYKTNRLSIALSYGITL